ncbi:unnamed protein product [Cochlearia groenlandica]
MVTIRPFCYLLIFFMFQFHAKFSNANFSSQGLQAANSECRGEGTNTQFVNKAVKDVLKNRKTLMHINVKVEANDEKNGFKIESKEMLKKKRKNKKRLTKTVSLTADYNDPGHHPPRHN